MFRSRTDFVIKKEERDNIYSINDGYCCDLCGQGPWPTELDVEIHRKNIHKWDLLRALKDDNTHMCSICLRVQPDEQALIEHILVNHLCCSPTATVINREIYICDHCNHLFFNKQLLITHIFHWHTKKTPDYSQVKKNCPKCWKSILGKSTWFHLLYHGAFNVGTCPICLKTCKNHLEMIEHLKIHPGYFRCDICNYETTKECYFNNHLVKHKKNVECDSKDDVSRFFLPQPMYPSLSNRMHHIFKGIPLANEVRICILCRALCVSDEQMKQHIYGAHVPDQKEKSKTYQCLCGEKFFNGVLLKHHIFKMKGNHGIWDGVTPIPQTNCAEDEIVYQIYEISDPLTVGMNEIIITGITSVPEETESYSDNQHVTEFEVMET